MSALSLSCAYPLYASSTPFVSKTDTEGMNARHAVSRRIGRPLAVSLQVAKRQRVTTQAVRDARVVGIRAAHACCGKGRPLSAFPEPGGPNVMRMVMRSQPRGGRKWASPDDSRIARWPFTRDCGNALEVVSVRPGRVPRRRGPRSSAAASVAGGDTSRPARRA